MGKILASALKYPYLDCDTLIEKMAGCSVAEIFSEEGEESFRELESQVLHVRCFLDASYLEPPIYWFCVRACCAACLHIREACMSAACARASLQKYRTIYLTASKED